MDFFSIGPPEVLLILIVALVIWSPGRLVEIGRSLGRAVHAFRKAAFDAASQVNGKMEEKKRPAQPQNSDRARQAIRETKDAR